MRHAAGAAIFDIVMDRVGVAARGLERREDRRGLGAARQHEALADHEILEPALLGHHAVRCGIELGHGVSCDNWFNSGPRGLPGGPTSLKGGAPERKTGNYPAATRQACPFSQKHPPSTNALHASPASA